MRTNIVIDDKLMRRAMRAAGLATKKATVEKGLELLVQIRKQAGIRSLRGRVEWRDPLSRMRSGRLPAPTAPSSKSTATNSKPDSEQSLTANPTTGSIS